MFVFHLSNIIQFIIMKLVSAMLSFVSVKFLSIVAVTLQLPVLPDCDHVLFYLCGEEERKKMNGDGGEPGNRSAPGVKSLGRI